MPPSTRTGSWASKSSAPSYAMVIPVHLLNSSQDFCNESDSGLMMDANMVTLVPECPANCWYLAQSPLSVGTEPPPSGVVEFEQAPSAVMTAIAGASTSNPRRRGAPLVELSTKIWRKRMCCPPWQAFDGLPPVGRGRRKSFRRRPWFR